MNRILSYATAAPMLPSRRRMLYTASLLPLLALTACPTGTGPTPAQIIADAQGIVNGLVTAVPGIAAALPTAIPAATLARIQAGLASAQSLLAGLSATTTATAGATVLQTVEAYINDALTVLEGVKGLPAQWTPYIVAAAALLPVIEQFVNSALGTVTTVAATRAATLAPAVAPAQARQTLAVPTK